MLDRLLAYPLERYETADWVLLTTVPRIYFVLMAAVFAVLIAFSLWRRRSSLKTYQIAVLGCLQLALLGFILALLLQPALQIERLVANTNHLLFLIDGSASMAYQDEGRSRIDRAMAAYNSNPLTELREDYSSSTFIFSDQLTPYDENYDLPAPGKVTRLADNLTAALQQASERSLAGVVLISDGADTSVDHYSSSLSSAQLAAIADFGVPVHTLGVGRERIAEDVELSDISLPSEVLPGSQVSASVLIRHDAPGEVRVKVYQGDKFITSKRVTLNDQPGLTRTELEFALEDSGIHTLQFQIDPIEGETNLANNSREALVEVKRQQYRVLYVEGEPRWDYKYIRRALNGDEQIKLNTLLWVSDQKFYRQGIDNETELAEGFPTDRAELFDYDALIIGSISAPHFTDEQQKMIHDFVSVRGGTLLMLGGREGLSDGGWGNTQVGQTLPSRLEDLKSGFQRARATARLVAEGEQNRFLLLDDEADSLAESWAGLPDLNNYQLIGSLRPAAETLLEMTPVDSSAADQATAASTPLPLLVSQPYGNGRSLILATGGTWRWQMGLPAGDLRQETFWRQMMRHLVVSSPEPVTLSLQQTTDQLQLTAEVRDRSFNSLDDVDVIATLQSDNGETETLTLNQRPGSPGTYELNTPLEQTGNFTLDLWVTEGDEPIANIRRAFHQDSSQAEAFAIRQNRAQLERIADSTGGQYWTLDQLEGLPEAIARSKAGVRERQTDPLWTVPLVWWLIILIKCSEWLLRRRWQRI